MKKFLINFFVTLIVLFLIVMNISVVMAVDTNSVQVSLSPSKANLSSGEEFTIEINQQSNNGLVAFESELEYDTNVLTLNNIVVNNNWSNLSSDNKLDAFSANDEAISSGNIFKLYFKVNESANNVSTTVTLKNISAYITESSSVQVNNASTSLTIGNVENSVVNESVIINTIVNEFSEDTNTVNNTVNNVVNNTVTNKTTNNTTTNNVVKNTVTNTTNKTSNNTTNTTNKTVNNTSNTTNTSNKVIPKTGSSSIKVLLIAGIVVIIAVILFRQYRKYKEI